MSTNKLLAISSLIILPLLYVIFAGLHLETAGTAIEHWLPKYDRLVILFTVVALEQVFVYRYAQSQRAVLKRDIIANVVNIYLNGLVTAFLLLPILLFATEHGLGRKTLMASPAELGPLWLQVPLIMIIVSLFRYWMHRWQHTNPFLWELHSYHHRVTDLKASNGEVSNPVDFSLRNIMIFVVLGVVGFDPFALLLAITIVQTTAVFSHCGADIKAGPLNFVFMTPEVHRWHHAVDVPKGYGYSCNYGVEFSFWDILFGTFYLPQENGVAVMPARIGHPEGIPDEPSYLRLLLMPFGLYGAAVRALGAIGITLEQGQQPAE